MFNRSPTENGLGLNSAYEHQRGFEVDRLRELYTFREVIMSKLRCLSITKKVYTKRKEVASLGSTFHSS